MLPEPEKKQLKRVLCVEILRNAKKVKFLSSLDFPQRIFMKRWLKRNPSSRGLVLCLGLVAFVAVTADHRVSFVDEPLAGGDARSQLALVAFHFPGLALSAKRPVF